MFTFFSVFINIRSYVIYICNVYVDTCQLDALQKYSTQITIGNQNIVKTMQTFSF